MTLDPLATAPLAIQLHVTAACPAIGLGPFGLYRRKREICHQSAGYTWVWMMVGVAVTGALIPSHDLALVGPFGPIHIPVPVTLWSLFRGLAAVLRGDIATHDPYTRALYWYGLSVARMFTLLSSRVLNQVLFHTALWAGLLVICAASAGKIAADVKRRRLRRQKVLASR